MGLEVRDGDIDVIGIEKEWDMIFCNWKLKVRNEEFVEVGRGMNEGWEGGEK